MFAYVYFLVLQMSHATATPNEYIQLFTVLFHLFSYTFFFKGIFFSKREIERKEERKRISKCTGYICPGFVRLKHVWRCDFGFFPFQKTTYILSDLFYFSRVLLLFPLFYFLHFWIVQHIRTMCAPCWTKFNLIFLINSNSFKYMH